MLNPELVPLKLRYTAETTVPVEIEGLTPDSAREKSVVELERFEILHGNRKVPLAELFKVTGDASDGRLNFEGNLSGVHWIGAKMSSGDIHIDGPAGRHVGSEMSGGHIHTHGDVGDHAGAEMRGGHLHVGGSAGNRVGAAYPGSRRGMTGGSIMIARNAGHEIGHLMRRGLIAVSGTSGDHVGFNMLAGSIVLFGKAGIRPGAGMKRGTIALLGDPNPTLLPTFRRACRFQPMAFRVVLRSLRNHHFEISDELMAAQFDLYNGDFLSGGRGEILVRASAPIGRGPGALVHNLGWLIGEAMVVLVRIYQWTLSPIVGRQCRFEPTCSHYMIGALRKYGPIVGVWRGTKRICRCHPFHHGPWYDPP